MSDNNENVILGVLAGVAIGATLGILFAPDKGSNTRKKIFNKGDKYVDELEQQFNIFIEGVTQKFETLKDEAAKQAETVKEKTEEVVVKANGVTNM